MLALRDPSPGLAQTTRNLFTPPGSPRAIKALPTPDIATVKTEDDTNTMEQRNEAGSSGSGSNNHPRRPNPQLEADAELARLLQEELARAAPGSTPAPSRLPPLTLQGFGIPPPQQGFPEHPFPAVPLPSMANWSAYDPQVHAQLEQFLRQTYNAHLPPDPLPHGGSPLEANQPNPFLPPPPAASPLIQHPPTAQRMSPASSGRSVNDSSVGDPPSSQGAHRSRTQPFSEIDHVMIAEEKRRRNTAASARFRIKKKQKTVNLERSFSDLQRRADQLERDATDLRRENTWLKEMVLLKGRKRVGKRQALDTLEETPNAEPSNKGNSKGKGKRKVAVVEQEEEEEAEDDYTSGSEEEGSEDEDEA